MCGQRGDLFEDAQFPEEPFIQGVLIAPPPLPEEGKPRRSLIHPKYQDLESTPLKFTVTRGRENKFNIEVE